MSVGTKNVPDVNIVTTLSRAHPKWKPFSFIGGFDRYRKIENRFLRSAPQLYLKSGVIAFAEVDGTPVDPDVAIFDRLHPSRIMLRAQIDHDVVHGAVVIAADEDDNFIVAVPGRRGARLDGNLDCAPGL